MKKRIWQRWIAAVLWALLILWGCGSAPEETAENTYTLYFTNSERYLLTTEERNIKGTGVQEIAFNMLDAMGEPEEVGDYSLFVLDGLVRRVNKEGDNLLGVYMTEDYSKLEVADEVLLRAGIVKTLIQLEGIDYVSLYVNEQPLTDASGKTVGIMSSNSFLDSKGENLSNYEQVMLTLYFGDETGSQLVETEREITISSSFSQERQVVNALLAGPEDSGLLATMPAGTDLISVSVKNKICYVNFSSSFLTGDLATSPYVTIYSLVNSLTELSTISKVQIMVDGDSTIRFRESIALDAPFERNLDYIMTGGNES